MRLFENAREGMRAKRCTNNARIKQALNGTSPKTAELMFDLSRGEKGTKLDNNRRAHVKAIELVSSLLGSFALPARPTLAYQGMIKDAVDQNGMIEDGVVRVGVTLNTLMGHRAHIEVPVIVRKKSLIEPAIFFFDDAPYVMCGPALEELVKRGALKKDMQARPMFSPPVDGLPLQEDLPRESITNHEHMFSPGARNPFNFRRQYSKNNEDDPKFDAWIAIDRTSEHKGEPRQRTNIDTPTEFPKLEGNEVQDEMLDPAERRRDKLHAIGTEVTLAEDVQARERGGGHVIIPKGERGKVLKDMHGDGKMLYIYFPAMCLSGPVPQKMLKGASKHAATLEQVQNEVSAMLREGYDKVDIKEAIVRRYPEQAEEALSTLNKTAQAESISVAIAINYPPEMDSEEILKRIQAMISDTGQLLDEDISNFKITSDPTPDAGGTLFATATIDLPVDFINGMVVGNYMERDDGQVGFSLEAPKF